MVGTAARLIRDQTHIRRGAKCVAFRRSDSHFRGILPQKLFGIAELE